jgi:phosphoserine phosphatase RsbU/P
MDTLEILPTIISQVTSDLAESVDCAWAVGFGPGLLPLCTVGAPPDLCRCAGYLSAEFSEQLQDNGEFRLYDLMSRQAWAPSIVCPIRVRGEDLAVLMFGPKKRGQAYTASDRDLISAFVAHVSTLMSNNRLAAIIGKKIENAQRSKADLESARQVQSRFFPLQRPAIRGLDYCGECQRMGEVGGDFFDFIASASSSLLLSVGEVSGKSIPAAIITAGLQASLRALGHDGRLDIAVLLGELNHLVWRVSPDNFFATMFCASVDSARRELHYSNAGHEPPLLIRKSRAPIRLETTGTVLGLSTRSVYGEAAIRLEPGDVLVAATNGITELLDQAEPEGYEQTVLKVVRDHPDGSSSDLVERILHAVSALAQDTEPENDRTVVVVRFTGAAVGACVSIPLYNKAIAYAVASKAVAAA